MPDSFNDVAVEARACTVCQPALDHPVRPVFAGTQHSRIRIIGQAPGVRVQASGKPFTDPSGVRLREWLGVSEDEFYDPELFAITPMGLCFPGLTTNGADKPPRRECAPLWQDRFTQALPSVELTLLIGLYGQRYHLKSQPKNTLTQNVMQWREHVPAYVAMPHPSWRNNAWLKRNPWFGHEVLPYLKERVRSIIQSAHNDRTNV